MSRSAKFSHRPKFDTRDGARRKALGDLLRRARKQAGLSQAAVAGTLGYTHQSNISAIENAKRFLDPLELENFAHLYGKTLNDFATWRTDQPGRQELLERAKSKQKEALESQRKYYKKPDRPHSLL